MLGSLVLSPERGYVVICARNWSQRRHELSCGDAQFSGTMASDSSSAHASGAELLRAENRRFTGKRSVLLPKSLYDSIDAGSGSNDSEWDSDEEPNPETADQHPGPTHNEARCGSRQDVSVDLFASCNLRDSLAEGIKSILDDLGQVIKRT